MKKTLLTILAFTAALVPAQAQLGNDGFYRVRSVTKPTDYVSLVDNQFSYNDILGWTGGGVGQYLKDRDNYKKKCIGAVQKYLAKDIAITKKDTQITDPGTILYFTKNSSSYDFQAQGTSLHEIATGTYTHGSTIDPFDINTVYATVTSTSGSSTSTQYIIGVPMKFTYEMKKLIITIPVDADLGTNYFCDENDSTLSYLDDSNKNRFWYIEPINDTDNYFAVKPLETLKQNGKYYTTLRTSFSYKVKDASHTTVYAVTSTPKNGVATLSAYKADAIIPAGMPVVIESTSPEAADNILVPQGVTTSTITTALYNNYGTPKRSTENDTPDATGDAIGYFKKAYKGTTTLYKLSTNDKGQVGFFTPVASGEVINGNEAYATAPCALYSDLFTSLAGLVTKEADSKTLYHINDGDLTAVAFGDDNVLYCKDSNAYASKDASQQGQVDYMKERAKLQTGAYDQSNWVALSVDDATATKLMNSNVINHVISGVEGVLTDKVNPTVKLTVAPTVGQESTYTPNTYIAASFGGTQTGTQGKREQFFFVTPKPCEVASITWAMWDGSKMVVPPYVAGKVNLAGLSGEFAYGGDQSKLKVNSIYSFEGIVKVNTASSKAGKHSAPAASGYTVYPLTQPVEIGSVNGNGVVTAVDSVNEAAAVARVVYYNLQGQSSAEPYEGVNIVKTVYTDGSTRVEKVVK